MSSEDSRTNDSPIFSKACHFNNALWPVMNLRWKGFVHQRVYMPSLDAGLDCFSGKRISTWQICCWYCIQKYSTPGFLWCFYPSAANCALTLFCAQSLRLHCNNITAVCSKGSLLFSQNYLAFKLQCKVRTLLQHI